MKNFVNLEFLDEEHREQRKLLALLNQALQTNPPDLDAALQALTQLDENLHEHFRREEEELFPLLNGSTHDEDAQTVLDQLTREHIELLLELSILRLGLQQPTVPLELMERLFEFVEFFENHSSLEHHLMTEFFQKHRA